MRGNRSYLGTVRSEIQQGESIFDIIGDEEKLTRPRLEDTLCGTVIEKAQQLVIKAIDVDQYGRLLVQAQILPGEYLEHLLEGSEATGQDEEGIGELGHLGLASVHGRGDVQFGQAAMSDLGIDEHFGDDADDTALAGKTGFRNRLHKAYVGSAVDDADVLFGKGAAECNGRLKVQRVRTVGGGAEDGCIPDHTLRISRLTKWQYEI